MVLLLLSTLAVADPVVADDELKIANEEIITLQTSNESLSLENEKVTRNLYIAISAMVVLLIAVVMLAVLVSRRKR